MVARYTERYFFLRIFYSPYQSRKEIYSRCLYYAASLPNGNFAPRGPSNRSSTPASAVVRRPVPAHQSVVSQRPPLARSSVVLETQQQSRSGVPPSSPPRLSPLGRREIASQIVIVTFYRINLDAPPVVGQPSNNSSNCVFAPVWIQHCSRPFVVRRRRNSLRLRRPGGRSRSERSRVNFDPFAAARVSHPTPSPHPTHSASDCMRQTRRRASAMRSSSPD